MTSNSAEYRIEHDTMGEVRVPVNALYRAQTQRAVENFPISGKPLDDAHIEALARIKKAAATANAELGVLDDERAKAIAAAADEVAAGPHYGQFPSDVFQTGSGTSSNMNTNEVLAEIATRALKAAGSETTVHPNDHVNASQSSNDVFPTSVHVAATSALINNLIPALEHLAVSLERKAEEFKDVVKSGRTHLMDATPVTLGQEFGGYAAQVRFSKIANDLRWMGSGPNTGLGEIAIPDLQPGSSIMPGKVNPVISEAVMQVAAQVVGNDAAIAWAGTFGYFELNVGIPVIASNLLESIRLLANSSVIMADKMIDGIEANVERARYLAEASPSIVTPLNKYIGYENAAKIAKFAVKEGKTIRQAVTELGFVERGEVTEEQLDAALDVLSMTKPPQA